MRLRIRNLFGYHDLIAAIVSALEARDTHTLHHSVRVSDMSDYICSLLKLGKKETRTIHIAADLHDIGKIGIPDDILFKTGSLSDKEWELMKSHTEVGFTVLNKVERFYEIARIVRHHHERWDGNGYPDGLAGLSIPLGSRIIGVADSIDAMLADRSYRKGLPSDLCRIEIEKNIGKMYDQRITDAVLDNWDKILMMRHKTV